MLFNQNGDQILNPGLYADLDGWEQHFLRFRKENQ